MDKDKKDKKKGSDEIKKITYTYISDNWRMMVDIKNNLLFQCYNPADKEWYTRHEMHCQFYE